MQRDMHYYATFAMAAAAGIPKADAEVIAHAAQFVDDQDSAEWIQNRGGSSFIGVATAHHPLEAGIRSLVGRKSFNDTREVWIPFHFLPGNEGPDVFHRLICRKDSEIARQMLRHYQGLANEPFALELAGIAAHVYADTFAHYGFSGPDSRFNLVDQNSIEIDSRHSSGVRGLVNGWLAGFMGKFADGVALGHGGVATYPDQPFLSWRFRYQVEGNVSNRDNPVTYLEACEKLYSFFRQFAAVRDYRDRIAPTPFDMMRDEIADILALEADREAREGRWMAAMGQHRLGGVTPCAAYESESWIMPLEAVRHSNDLSSLIDDPAYRFHVAADYHRFFVLRRLLPSYGLLVE